MSIRSKIKGKILLFCHSRRSEESVVPCGTSNL